MCGDLHEYARCVLAHNPGQLEAGVVCGIGALVLSACLAVSPTLERKKETLKTTKRYIYILLPSKEIVAEKQ